MTAILNPMHLCSLQIFASAHNSHWKSYSFLQNLHIQYSLYNNFHQFQQKLITMAFPRSFTLVLPFAICVISVASLLSQSSADSLSNVVAKAHHNDHDDEKSCPEKCVTGPCAWRVVSKSCKMKCGGGPAKCGHDGHSDVCMITRCKKNNKMGYKCTCKHQEDEEDEDGESDGEEEQNNGDSCPYTCFAAGNKWALAKASCTENGKKLQCAHGDHFHDCQVQKCTVGDKSGYWCGCA